MEYPLTDKSNELYVNALNNAKDRGHTQVTPSHLVLAMLEDDEFLPNVLSQSGVSDNFRRTIRSDLKKLPTQNPPPARVGPSTMLVKALNDASKSQRKLGDAFIALDTLIASLFGIDFLSRFLHRFTAAPHDRKDRENPVSQPSPVHGVASRTSSRAFFTLA